MRLFGQLVGIFLGGVAIAILAFQPVVAQDNIANTAPALVDGQILFEVSSSGQFLAQERADFINEQLQKAADTPGVELVEVVSRNDLPAILLDRSYLMTVTERDAEAGRTAAQQAAIWAEAIHQALFKANQERSLAFLQHALVKVVLALALAAFLHWGAAQVLRLSGVETGEPGRLGGGQWLVLNTTRATIWLATAYYISNVFPLTRQWSYNLRQRISNSLTAPILPIDDNTYSAIDLLVLAMLLLGLVVSANHLSSVLRSRVLQIAHLNRAAQDIIATVLKYSLIVIGTVVVFNLWGVNLTSLTVLAGALSVGIGFGFQDIAKNLGSGIVLLFERPIQVGDFIEVGEYVGTVERIGSRSTLIRTLDRVSIIVPNSRFLETEVINWSHDNPVSRLRLPVGVAYGSNLSTVKQALLAATRRHSQVLPTPPPKVLFVGLGDSSLDFELLVWCADPSQQYDLKSDLYFSIETELKIAGVEIPFPQRDLNLRTGQLPIALSPQLEKMLGQLLDRFGR
ncbi:MAG: mechanosensitive ion channel [Cyanobacteria bacterium SID2]|nr:mechanosensitive ion channel [Cyanobacteria bacterium SID2]MBP0005096.1 mechanosensitive ion channel [Cyanobacteria bacterium SBC]